MRRLNPIPRHVDQTDRQTDWQHVETDNHIKRDIAMGGTISSDNFIMLSIRQTSFTFVRLLELLLLLLLTLQLRTTINAAPIPSPNHLLLPSSTADLNVMAEESVLTLAADVRLSPDDVINGQSSSTMEEEEQFFSAWKKTLNHFGSWQKLSNRIEDDDEENNKVDGLQEQKKEKNNNYEEDIRNLESSTEEEDEFWSAVTANKWKRHLITGPTFDNCPSGQRWVRNECRDVLFVDNQDGD